MNVLQNLHYQKHSSEIFSLILQIYDENELLQVKLDILSKTNMVDYAIDIRKQLYPNEEVPEVGWFVIICGHFPGL
jgi:hypothetical protein